MSIEIQFKVSLYSFIFGIYFFAMYKLFSEFKFKNKLINLIFSIIFLNLQTIIFYAILYKINFGMLNVYIFIFLGLGVLFSKSFYFNNKKY